MKPVARRDEMKAAPAARVTPCHPLMIRLESWIADRIIRKYRRLYGER